ncbi:MAG TPA: TIGR03854 family LLM class F420-dependent oxidoreductase [Chloroflexota bacterium]|nr:TIGR03854 family LLM class F420-dependent oxidoreductase [Chloroflexota bacterium]
MKVRIGFALGVQGDGHDAGFGRLVDDLERLGFDSLWLSERVSSPIYDPLLGLAYAAARTRRLKLGTSVLVLPGRNPVLLAKELASLDRLSDGRLLPAFGLGADDPAERAAFGVAPRERGAWLDETLPLLRRLWTEDTVDHTGVRFTYHGLRVRPRPVQPALDLWLGGRAPAALRRVGRLADGWLPGGCTPAEAAAGRRTIEAAAAEAGRAIDPEHYGAIVVYAHADTPPAAVAAVAARRPDVDPRELVPIGLPALRATLHRFTDAGVSKFLVRPAAPPASWTAELEALAAAILPLQT